MTLDLTPPERRVVGVTIFDGVAPNGQIRY
jgi:hypothetical protein